MPIWRNLDKNKQLFNLAARSKPFIVFDTETTGLRKEDEIVEFAACKCTYKDGDFYITNTLHVYIKPSKPIPEEVSQINGLTNDFLDDKPTEQEVFPLIRGFLGEKPVVGAYNSGFDVRMTKAMYARCGNTLELGGEVDFLKIAKDIFCEQKMKDHKLATIANTYGVDSGIEFHSALDDVRVLIRVVNAMLHDIQDNGVVKTEQVPVTVYKLNYYDGFRGNSRIYAITSAGPIYYDLKNDRWMPNDERVHMEQLDMDSVEAQVFRLANVQDYKELRKRCREGALAKKGA